MAPHHILKRAVYSLVLLAALAAATDADAQRRRMPVRTEPIPDTETGGKAGTAGNVEPQNPGMMIYGPPDPILGAPPLPPVPAAVTPPAPAATPPVAAPAPVVTPIPATPAPVAAPVPAPAPAPAPVAIPVPAPAPPPAPVAVPAPAPVPPPAPIAVPAPAPVPPPGPVAIPAPAPVPPPAPVAAPVPAPAPRVAPVAIPSPPPPPPAPVAIPAPVIVPPPVIAPVAIPAPAPQPAPEAPRPVIAVPAPAPAPAAPLAAIAPAPTPFTSPKLDAKLVEQIFSCLAPGLPQDWKRTWVVVTSAEAAVATKFFYTTTYRDEDAEEFVPCSVGEITRRITGLSDSLAPSQRRWKSARLAIDSEGEYELVYNYK